MPRTTPLLLALLCLIAYARSLDIPLIEDDYPNLFEAQRYGPPSGLAALAGSPVARMRATSYWSMYWLWNVFHLWAPGYHMFSLALHILATWLVYGIGLGWPRMRAGAPWAAALFAVHEGHQEAVMWFSAINELWMFVFGAAALLCFLRKRWYGIPLYALALISKESAVVFPALFLLVAPRSEWRRMVPYAVLAAAAVAAVFLQRAGSFRFSDGSFSLLAPFWITWPRGILRLLWIWGWPAILAIWLSRDSRLRRSAMLAIAWIAVAFAPYVFLTYSTAIPSRQTYLASAGLAWLFGLAVGRLFQDNGTRRRWAAAILAVMLFHNVATLWTRKRRQFLERAEPTRQLIELARRTDGPIWVRCFPRHTYIAQEAVRMGAGRDPAILLWTEAEAQRRPPAAEFCYSER
jgi:hypothetical protein